MGKPWYVLPCIFVYKTISYIIKIPIMLIKYFSLGFFFTSTFFIDILVTSLYLFFKYLFYGFIRICEWLYLGLKFVFIYKKKPKEIIEEKTITDDLSLVDIDNKSIENNIDIPSNEMLENSIDIPLNDIPINEPLENNIDIPSNDVLTGNTISDEELSLLDNIELQDIDENIDTQELVIDEEKLSPLLDISDAVPLSEVKDINDVIISSPLESLEPINVTKASSLIGNENITIKKAKKSIKISKPLIVMCIICYRFFAIITKPLLWLVYGLIYEYFILYKMFKYLLYGIVFPAVLISILFSSLLLKYRIAIEKSKDKQEKKFAEKLRKQNEENLKKQEFKEKNEYVNEAIIVEHKSFADKLNDFFILIGEAPKNIKNSISKWYHNLSLVKNFENQKNIASEALLLKFDGEDAEKSPTKIVYEYRAKNSDGKIVTDYFEAYSKVEVHSFLLSEGFEVYNIRTSKYIQFFHGKFMSGGGVKFKTKDLIFFLTQLSTYLKAGIPLVEALKILNKQYSKKKQYQKIFRKLIYDLTMGENFSTALDKQGDTFPRLLINMAKASELTGELPETLDKMADYYTETHKTRQQMITALTYPTIVLVLSIAVFTFMMLYIIPKFVAIYDTMDNVQIPGITRVILGISNYLQKNIVWVALGIILVLFVLIYLYKNIKSFRTVIQLLIMRLPIFGNIIIFNEVTMFTQTLGTLLSHNVFITDSMEILNKITNNEVYKMIILDTINNIAKGEKISAAFEHWAFPIPAYEMIVTGEKTGQLPEMMEKVGNYYQELHRNAVTRIKTFLEPVLIIFLTLMVGVIILAIVIPMFNMYSAIQGTG